MTQNRKRSRRKQLRNIFMWLELRASSPTKRIDGLWIGIGGGVQGQDKRQDHRLLDRVEEALALIKRYARYDRLSRDLKRVWVHVIHGVLGSYNEAFAACELDARFVLPETTTPSRADNLVGCGMSTSALALVPNRGHADPASRTGRATRIDVLKLSVVEGEVV
jgi:hypothetical protein